MSESYQPEIEKLKNDFVNWCCTRQTAISRPPGTMTAVEWALDEIGRTTLYYLQDKMKIRPYNGPRHGRQLVHAVTIPREDWSKTFNVENSDNWHAIVEPYRKQGEEDLHFIVPEAVHRIGCNCCQGDGPDIDIRHPKVQHDGSAVVEFWVDFDFRMPEAEENEEES